MESSKDGHAVVISTHKLEAGDTWVGEPGPLTNRIIESVMSNIGMHVCRLTREQKLQLLAGETVFYLYRVRIPSHHLVAMVGRGLLVSYPVEEKLGELAVTETVPPESSFGVITLTFQSFCEAERSYKLTLDLAFFTDRTGFQYWLPTVIASPPYLPIDLCGISDYTKNWEDLLLGCLPNYLRNTTEQHYRREKMVPVKSVEDIAFKDDRYAFEPSEVVVISNIRIHNLYRFLGRSTEDGRHVAEIEAAERMRQFVSDDERFWLLDKGQKYLVIAKTKV